MGAWSESVPELESDSDIFIPSPVQVLLQQVQTMLHLSVGEVRVAVVLGGAHPRALGGVLGAPRRMWTRPPLLVEFCGEERTRGSLDLSTPSRAS